MKHSSSLLLAFIVSVTSAFSQQSPMSAFTLGGGITNIQGETTSKKITATIGPEVSLLYSFYFKNRRWAGTAEASHSIVDADLSFASPSPDSNLTTQIEQTYFGIGVRHVLNPSITEGELHTGQLLPYLGLSFGAVNTSNDINLDVDKLGGYVLHPENSLDFTISAEFGVLFILSLHWAMEAYIGARSASIDSWDGLSGTGDGNDWIIRSGLGIQYHF